MIYDFTVCGAGPIGSYLAWKLSELDYKVLVLEEHSKIGEPVSCSGLISNNIWKYIPKKSLKKDVVERKIKGARLHLGKKKHTFVSNQANVLNRNKLDKFIAHKAEEAGAKFAKESKLFSFFESDEKVSLYIKSKNFRNTKTKILAGCDGPLSIVRENMGIRQPNFLHGIFCYVKEEPDSFVDLYYKKAPGFFAWRIPRGEDVEYGLASDVNAKKYFESFSKKMKIKYNKVYSGLIPYGLLPRITGKRVFLCGDAASHVKPHTGGGVVYGIKSADIASTLIKPDSPNMKSYESAWRKKLSKEINIGTWIKRAYSLPSPLLNMVLNSLSKKQGLEMDRPSSMW